MNIGALDRRIVIQQNTATQDGFGEMIASWSTLATVWAAKKKQTGREFLADADQTVGERKTVWVIRWRTDVTNLMRVSYDGDFYNINDVNEIGRKAGLELMTTAIEVV